MYVDNLRSARAIAAAATRRINRMRACARGSALVGWWDQAGRDYEDAIRAYDSREVLRKRVILIRQAREEHARG